MNVIGLLAEAIGFLFDVLMDLWFTFAPQHAFRAIVDDPSSLVGWSIHKWVEIRATEPSAP